MQYSVPTNWEMDLVPALEGLPVAELYGQLPRDFVSGGRASLMIGGVSRRRMRAHVAQVLGAGLRFNYVLNATTMANREWSVSGQRKLESLLAFLLDTGVGRVTVSIPYLLEFIKRRAPDLEVMVSTQTMVATPDCARRWEDLGADGITLSVLDVQRDFGTLKAIRGAVDLPLQLIGNLLCLQGCPAGSYHAALNAHASQTGMSRFVIDYCTFECNRRRLAHPEEIIRAGWIRPEDQHYYEEIGIDRIKLVTRGMTTAALAPIAKAYADRLSPANLMDLFPTPDKMIVASRSGFWHLLRHFAHPMRVNLFRLRKMKALADRREVVIDSAKLNGFLEPFLAGRCTEMDCETCGYCAAVARRAIRFENGYQEQTVHAHDEMLDEILSGRLFSYGANRRRFNISSKKD